MDGLTIEKLILGRLPDAEVQVENLRRDGESRFMVRVSSPSFEGQPLVQQHRMVYAAFRGVPEDDMHSLSLKTSPRKLF